MPAPLQTAQLPPTPAGIATAAAILRAGGLVAMPTETVYGLAAIATNPAAVERIFTAKDRPHWDPLIVHISDPAQLGTIAAAVSPLAQDLIDAFWPGPLTLLLPRHPGLPLAVTAGRELVGVRMPAHLVARALIAAARAPLAAPSANRFGHVSPTTAAHVLADLDGRIDAVLDGGPCTLGMESTVFDPATLTLYRPGSISAEAIAAAAGAPVHLYEPPAPTVAAPPESLPSPGVGIRHYAPRALLLVAHSEAHLQHLASHPEHHQAAILLPTDWTLAHHPGPIHPWAPWSNPAALAHTLYAALRALDALGTATILAPVPQGEADLHRAIRDRLEKAARPR